MKPLAFIASALLAVATGAAPAHAQATTVTVNYSAGWNMVGGPPGTSFAGAYYVETYVNGSYVVPATRASAGCQGAWAYFNAPAAIQVSADASIFTASCGVPAGWSLLGNPLSSPAELPSGFTAFYYNASTSSYQTVNEIPVGASVWVYETAASTVVLTSRNAPASLPAPTVTINPFASAGSYSVHVGDVIEVLVPAETLYSASLSPTGSGAAPLELITAGLQEHLSCVGDPGCVPGASARFWLYRAVAPGTATISLSPSCLTSVPACGLPSIVIRITVS